MPSERILNKLFEIAQENTSEEVNYNDFVKDILNSADLSSEDKTYNAEDEYLRNLLAFAKHDSRIFGEYRDGKFVISESIINFAKKETQRQIDVKRKQVDNLKQTEGKTDTPFGKISEMLKSFSDLDLSDKLHLIQNTMNMDDTEIEEYHKSFSEMFLKGKEEGILSEEQYEEGQSALDLQKVARSGEELERYIRDVLLPGAKEGNKKYVMQMSQIIDMGIDLPIDIEKDITTNEFLKSKFKDIINQGRIGNKITTDNANIKTNFDKDDIKIIGEYLSRIVTKHTNFIDHINKRKLDIKKISLQNKSENLESGSEVLSSQIYAENTYSFLGGDKKMKDTFKHGDLIPECAFLEEYTEIIKKLDGREEFYPEYKKFLKAFEYRKDSEKSGPISISEIEKEFFQKFVTTDVEEKKASEESGLEDLAVFDGGFEDLGLPANGDLMSAFGEFSDASPVTDVEFAEAFDVTEIGRAKTEEPKTVDTALEEPEKGEGSVLPSSITIEKINSDAVSPVRKDDKLETKSVIKFAETFVKSSSYLKKMKDVKEFAHAGIDNNKSTEIGDIA